MYRKLGFLHESNYSFYQINKPLQKSPNQHIRPMKAEDFNELLKMDFQATRELRKRLLNQVLETGLVYFDKKTEGFYLPELGQGYSIYHNLILAANPEQTLYGSFALPEVTSHRITAFKIFTCNS